MLTAVRLLVLVASSNPKQIGNWENWAIGVVVVVVLVAVVYWVLFTESGESAVARWRKGRG